MTDYFLKLILYNSPCCIHREGLLATAVLGRSTFWISFQYLGGKSHLISTISFTVYPYVRCITVGCFWVISGLNWVNTAATFLRYLEFEFYFCGFLAGLLTVYLYNLAHVMDPFSIPSCSHEISYLIDLPAASTVRHCQYLILAAYLPCTASLLLCTGWPDNVAFTFILLGFLTVYLYFLSTYALAPGVCEALILLCHHPHWKINMASAVPLCQGPK